MSDHPNEPKGRLAAINRSGGGVPKSQVSEAVITEAGIEGDRQRNASIHGGPDRAVVLYSLERIEALASEGHAIDIGTVGENLTISGLDWALVVPGTELQIGPVRLQITKYTAPCNNISNLFTDGDSSRISQKRYPGWSRVCARVLKGGVLHVGSPVTLPDQASAASDAN